MKKFTTIKVGYTAGIYGCSGEYFTTIILNNDDVKFINHNGLYGSEHRINSILKDAGYKEFYTPSTYGKLTRKDIPKTMFSSEHVAIEELKTMLKGGIK